MIECLLKLKKKKRKKSMTFWGGVFTDFIAYFVEKYVRRVQFSAMELRVEFISK